MSPRSMRFALGSGVVVLSLFAPTPTMASPADAPPARTLPLAGLTIVLDPGHQLGNARHPEQINQLVNAGGYQKPCNTTGTATSTGYAEATFAFRVAQKVRKRLEARGATVIMTRYRNSNALWGPCIDVRGKLGNRSFRGRARNADLKLSLHGDGAAASARGFHVIIADKRQSKRASTRFARATRHDLARAGFPRSTYIGGGTALDFRGDLGTLNLSRFPTIMVELGNMRNARDAAAMTSRAGQKRYAKALTRAARRFLT